MSLVRKDVVETKLSGGEAISPRNVHHWELTLPLVPQTLEQARTLWGNLCELSKPDVKFIGYPPAFIPCPYAQTYWNGSAWTTGTSSGGAPFVNGANQTGTSLNINNLVPSTTIFNKGDYFAVNTDAFGYELKVVTADCVSDASGEATVEFTPALRDAALNISEVGMHKDLVATFFRLKNPQASYALNPNKITTITIEAVEAYD